MNLNKETEVLILPIKGDETINCPIIKCIGYNNELKIINKSFTNTRIWEGQHLYFLSDEKIKESNEFHWFYNPETKVIFKSTIQHFGTKLIIASTDKSLKLAEPHPEFINEYVEEWNKGNIIRKVMVDYEETQGNCDCYYTKFCKAPEHIKTGELCRDEQHIKLKVDKNNYISIAKIKDSWTKEELPEVLERYLETAYLSKDLGYMNPKKWVEQNL